MTILLAVAGCSPDSTSTVDPATLPEDVCELVDSEVTQQWSLGDGTSSTRAIDHELLNTGTCAMPGPDSTKGLVLSVTSFGGGDAASAREVAGKDFVTTCANLSGGAGLDPESDSCSVSDRRDGISSATAAVEAPAARGTVRVELTVPSADVDAVLDSVSTIARDAAGRLDPVED